MSNPPTTSETPARKRGNWLRFSLRSLFVLVTLSCLLVGGKLQYDWYRKRSLIARWVEPLAVQAYVPVDASAVWGTWPPLPRCIAT